MNGRDKRRAGIGGVLAGCLLAAGCGEPVAAREHREDDVLAVYAEYREAIGAGDAKAYAELLDAATLIYYAELKRLAEEADRAELEARDLGIRHLALRVRLEMDPAEVRGMSVQEFVGAALRKGWIQREEVQRTGIGPVQFEGDKAAGEMLLDGEPTGALWAFRHQDDGWKVCMLPVLQQLNAFLQAMARERGQDENEFLVEMLAEATGREIPDDIWDPPSR